MILLAICLWLALTDAASIWLSYASDKNSWWSMTMMFLVGVVQSGNWLLVLRLSQSEKELLVLSLVWEFIQSIVFLAVPIIFFGVRLNFVNSCGVGLLVLGMFLCRYGST